MKIRQSKGEKSCLPVKKCVKPCFYFEVCYYLKIFMDDKIDTPKKVTYSDSSGCFICSLTVEGKQRVKNFGRSTDLAGDISSVLDVNLDFSFDESLI